MEVFGLGMRGIMQDWYAAADKGGLQRQSKGKEVEVSKQDRKTARALGVYGIALLHRTQREGQLERIDRTTESGLYLIGCSQLVRIAHIWPKRSIQWPKI